MADLKGSTDNTTAHAPKPSHNSKRLANPAPTGLCAFALTTFLLSLVNLRTEGVTQPSLVIASAYGYGGLIQLLAGMWEMAAGNTFNATAFSSLSGFWFTFAIIFTPGGFEIISTLGGDGQEFYDSFGFFLMGWFIFTFLIVIATLRATLAIFLTFAALDLAFLILGCGYLVRVDGAPHSGLIKAGGVFGILAAFLAWYNALAELLDESNSFFIVPVGTFSWARNIQKEQ